MAAFVGRFSVKSVFWLSALREEEKDFSQTVIDDLRIVLNHAEVPFQNYNAISSAVFEDALQKIAKSAKEDGMRPILHLDMHDSKELGLEIGATREFVSWPRVVTLLRGINVATDNNLCVVSASCFGFHAISEATIAQPTPFYVLIAPEHEVLLSFLGAHTADFYRDVFGIGDVAAAFAAHLSSDMRMFNADEMLFIAIARYIKNHCKGKAIAARREQLLTEVFLAGMPRTTENLKEARRKIRSGLRPNQSLLNKYVHGFLLGKEPGFDFDDLLAYVEQNQ